MTERIYLDHNVIADVYQDRRPGLRDVIEARKAAGAIFPYSPAHMEEIAVILRCQVEPEKAHRMIDEQVALVASLSDTWEILPDLQNTGPSRVVQEHPSACMARVLRDYDRTLSSEENERFQLSWKSEKTFDQVQDEFGSGLRAGPGVELFPEKRKRVGIGRGITGLAPEKIFDESGVLTALREKLWNHGWTPDTMPRGTALMLSHVDRQNSVNALFKVLEQAGYYADPFDKSRSHMHDVSHAIYAAEAEVFVTGDERFAKRMWAVYHYLGITTRVFLVGDWMAEIRAK